MLTPFSSEDLGRLFDSRALTRGRSLVLLGAVRISLEGSSILGTVEALDATHEVRLTPALAGNRVTFETACTCHVPACTHLAAAAWAALDRFPALRKADPAGLFETLAGPRPASAEHQVLRYTVEAGMPPASAYVHLTLVGERSGEAKPVTARAVLANPTSTETGKSVARLLGGGAETRCAVPPHLVPAVLKLLVGSPNARWGNGGRRLIAGEDRLFETDAPPRLPPGSAVLLSDSGHWYVDAATGKVGRARMRRKPAAPPPPPMPRVADTRPKHKRGGGPSLIETDSQRAIVERPVSPVLRMQRVSAPDGFGRLSMIDALMLEFDYGGVLTDADDERQFVRVITDSVPSFVRRNWEAEAQAAETLREDGFVQMRLPDPRSAKGRRVYVFRGEGPAEQWHRFVTERVPALTSLGFRAKIEGEFGPRLAKRVGACEISISDAEIGHFAVDFSIEIDGEKIPLLPVLSNLLARGGMEQARIVDGEVITSLEDGRVVKLPQDRIRRMLGIIGDLIEAAERRADGALVLPATEAPAMLELEEIVQARWENAAAIETYAARFRAQTDFPEVKLPSGFTAVLRPYQAQGVAWMQHLMAHNLGAFLADDMGLGKTAQTIAHLCVEYAAGRMAAPVLIVVPTSLMANWVSELGKFAPALKVEVLHGLGRHHRRERLEDVQVVITTYTVLARDVEDMKALPWHMIVLDEAQAIKSPEAKATRAVCQLQSRQRICLSGTPIENNLDELWSQFAFLMPGLLGDRKGFAKRYRTPIEKNNDQLRRAQLARRIKPFIMRRRKSEVATELPPKHTILRRITLAPDQRELYETIRVTMYEKVREQVAERSLSQSRIVVLDALLKLRQACCDPRLVKLPSARSIEGSSKLDDLIDMVGEMIPEGRRILLFSQFTSMLDLIKPKLHAAGVKFVELRGSTIDRAEPVRAFEAGEVPLFLISLKAGGRGLNLVSADTVIHYDPWWNPAVEDQASDRAHRIGQTKSVFVYKLIAADTVEERILELQQRKADLANIAFSEGGELANLDLGDIDYLFGQTPARIAA
jgi:superfamily II DNA or RNA helicase